jgi:hypothetical protein
LHALSAAGRARAVKYLSWESIQCAQKDFTRAIDSSRHWIYEQDK